MRCIARRNWGAIVWKSYRTNLNRPPARFCSKLSQSKTLAIGTRQLSVQQVRQIRGVTAHANIKRPKCGVYGANLVEAHFVDQLLENHWIVREKIHAPFPIVVADRTGDDLFHRSGIPAADHPVLVHLSLPL